jgi:uncharacterized membrane protein
LEGSKSRASPTTRRLELIKSGALANGFPNSYPYQENHMNKQWIAAAAFTAALGATLATPVFAADMEKCYGIAKAGQNDCKGNSHSCAGQATKSMDKGEFKAVAKGTCSQMGGSLTPGM